MEPSSSRKDTYYRNSWVGLSTTRSFANDYVFPKSAWDVRDVFEDSKWELKERHALAVNGLKTVRKTIVNFLENAARKWTRALAEQITIHYGKKPEILSTKIINRLGEA